MTEDKAPDIRLKGFTQMHRDGFVIYNAFNHPLVTIDNRKWPPDVIHVYSDDGNGKWTYVPEKK